MYVLKKAVFTVIKCFSNSTIPHIINIPVIKRIYLLDLEKPFKCFSFVSQIFDDE